MKAYKTEIKPNKKQIALIHQTFGNTRYIYNQFISYNFKRLENNQPIISGYDYSKMINNDPNRPDWLIKSPSKAIKQAIMNGQKAIWDYLKGKKGKPNFKKKTKDNSFYLIESINVERHRIFLPKLKWVRLKEFGYIPNNVKFVTVSMKNGRYFVSCLTDEVNVKQTVTSTHGIGIDFGLKDQFITKNETIPSINKSKRVRKLEKKLKQKQRALSRKYENNMINKVYYKSGKKKGHLKSFDWKRPLQECKNLNKNQRLVSKLEMVLAKMPEIARAVAEPLSRIDSITMFGEGNSSKLVGDIMTTTEQINKGLGLNIQNLIQDTLTGTVQGRAMARGIKQIDSDTVEVVDQTGEVETESNDSEN